MTMEADGGAPEALTLTPIECAGPCGTTTPCQGVTLEAPDGTCAGPCPCPGGAGNPECRRVQETAATLRQEAIDRLGAGPLHIPAELIPILGAHTPAGGPIVVFPEEEVTEGPAGAVVRQLTADHLPSLVCTTDGGRPLVLGIDPSGPDGGQATFMAPEVRAELAAAQAHPEDWPNPKCVELVCVPPDTLLTGEVDGIDRDTVNALVEVLSVTPVDDDGQPCGAPVRCCRQEDPR